MPRAVAGVDEQLSGGVECAMGKAKQAFYSLGELAKMSGVSKNRLERVLASNGVEMQKTGLQGRRFVFVAELERKLPDLVDSVRFRDDD